MTYATARCLNPVQQFGTSKASNAQIEPHDNTELTSQHGTVTPRSRRLSRPETSRATSTPLGSDATRLRACTMGASINGLKTLHDSGAMTPPATPTELQQKQDTDSSYFTPHSTHISTARPSIILRVDTSHGASSAGEPHSAGSIEEAAQMHTLQEPRSEDLMVFSYWISDYSTGDKKRRKLLGSGLWSDVYLAVPSLNVPAPSSPSPTSSTRQTGIVTPPATPIHSREPSISFPTNTDALRLSLQAPNAYAIKTPASGSAKRVLTDEARVLTYLSHFPGSSDHIIRFYGQDTRNDALVMKAMDMTLEHWVKSYLNTLTEELRAKELSSVFPRLAKKLLEGLEWLGEKCVTHSDIKPSNILLEMNRGAHSLANGESRTGVSKAVYSDFSSATISPEATSPETPKRDKKQQPLGGGTWDYLDPALLVTHSAPCPSASSDLWALAVTLLFVVIGCSPFDCMGTNVFRRRECVKQGAPMVYVGCGDEGVRNLKRLRALGRDLRWDVEGWFGRVLSKEGERLGLRGWKQMMGGGGE